MATRIGSLHVKILGRADVGILSSKLTLDAFLRRLAELVGVNVEPVVEDGVESFGVSGSFAKRGAHAVLHTDPSRAFFALDVVALASFPGMLMHAIEELTIAELGAHETQITNLSPALIYAHRTPAPIQAVTAPSTEPSPPPTSEIED